MSQLTQALEVIKDISQVKARLIKDRAELNEILGRSQNRPPDGGSDGSIQESTWYRLRTIRDNIDGLTDAIDKLDLFTLDGI